MAVMQGTTGAGNNEQQNVVHREAIETGGKLFVSINGSHCAIRSLLINEKKEREREKKHRLKLIYARILLSRFNSES